MLGFSRGEAADGGVLSGIPRRPWITPVAAAATSATGDRDQTDPPFQYPASTSTRPSSSSPRTNCLHVPPDESAELRHRHVPGVGHVRSDKSVIQRPQRMAVGQRLRLRNVERRSPDASGLQCSNQGVRIDEYSARRRSLPRRRLSSSPAGLASIMFLVSSVTAAANTRKSASPTTESISSRVTVFSAPSSGRPDRLTPMMRAPNGVNIGTSSRPMPPVPTTTTTMSFKRRSGRPSPPASHVSLRGVMRDVPARGQHQRQRVLRACVSVDALCTRPRSIRIDSAGFEERLDACKRQLHPASGRCLE